VEGMTGQGGPNEARPAPAGGNGPGGEVGDRTVVPDGGEGGEGGMMGDGGGAPAGPSSA